MTETPQTPPPGFYPDQHGVQRWWDGNAWTEHTQQTAAAAPTVSHAAVTSRPDRPWFKKKRIMIPGVLVALLVVGAIGGAVDSSSDGTGAPTSSQEADIADPASDKPEAADETTKASKPKPKPSEKPKPTKKAKPKPELTSGQRNALAAAENYLSFAPFSHDGLVEQLSSEFGDGYAKADAVYAADHVDADWNEQAAKAAENYLEISPFSRNGMIEQLSSAYGDKYTRAQAEYGATKAGL